MGALADAVLTWLVPAVADVPLGDAPDVLAGLAAGCAVCCGLASGCADDPVEAAAGADVPLTGAAWLLATDPPIAPPAAAAAIVAAVPPVDAAWLVLDPVPDWLAGLTVPAVADVPLCDAPDAPTGLAVGCAVCCGLFSGCAADPVEAAAGAEAPFCDAVWLAVAAAAPIAPPAAAAAIVADAWLVLDPVPDWLAGLAVDCAVC